MEGCKAAGVDEEEEEERSLFLSHCMYSPPLLPPLLSVSSSPFSSDGLCCVPAGGAVASTVRREVREEPGKTRVMST